MAQPKLNDQFNQNVLKSVVCRSTNIYEKRHLELDGKSVKVVSDGFCDLDKEVQSELKNAGLQNILKLQELRYGTIDNAIARASDRGIYADVSEIPESIGERAEYINKVNLAVEQLKKDLGLTDDDLKSLDVAKLTALYEAKLNPVPTPTQTDGGDQ